MSTPLRTDIRQRSRYTEISVLKLHKVLSSCRQNFLHWSLALKSTSSFVSYSSFLPSFLPGENLAILAFLNHFPITCFSSFRQREFYCGNFKRNYLSVRHFHTLWNIGIFKISCPCGVVSGRICLIANIAQCTPFPAKYTLHKYTEISAILLQLFYFILLYCIFLFCLVAFLCIWFGFSMWSWCVRWRHCQHHLSSMSSTQTCTTSIQQPFSFFPQSDCSLFLHLSSLMPDSWCLAMLCIK